MIFLFFTPIKYLIGKNDLYAKCTVIPYVSLSGASAETLLGVFLSWVAGKIV